MPPLDLLVVGKLEFVVSFALEAEDFQQTKGYSASSVEIRCSLINYKAVEFNAYALTQMMLYISTRKPHLRNTIFQHWPISRKHKAELEISKLLQLDFTPAVKVRAPQMAHLFLAKKIEREKC